MTKEIQQNISRTSQTLYYTTYPGPFQEFSRTSLARFQDIPMNMHGLILDTNWKEEAISWSRNTRWLELINERKEFAEKGLEIWAIMKKEMQMINPNNKISLNGRMNLVFDNVYSDYTSNR